MRYEDIVALALEYKKAEKTPYIAPEIIDPVTERRWVQETTKKLQLEELLTAVKDDVWQTGTISAINMPWSLKFSTPAQGFMLQSDPYHVVTFAGEGRNTRAKVHQEAATLSIFVTGRNEEYDRMVHFIDSKIYNLTDFRHPIYKSIQFFGISLGIRNALVWQEKADIRELIEPNCIPALAHAITEAVTIRERSKSLPQSLYEKSERLNQEIPELVTKGSFSANELRDWGYANQGTPWVIRQLDRAFPYLMQL